MSVQKSNDLVEIPFSVSQAEMLGTSLDEYDAPEMYWGDDSNRSEKFRRECAEDIFTRLDRGVKRNGLDGFSVTFSDEEYRVCIEALVQTEGDHGDLIKHLQYFRGGATDGA